MHHRVEWDIVQFLWTVNVLGSALVAWCLFSLQLGGKYRFFFLNMALSAARSLTLWNFGPRTHTYYEIWVYTEPVLWLSYILVVYELYSLVLKQYQGIYSVGRWFFFGAVATSSIVAALTVMTTTSNMLSKNQPLVFPYLLFERLVFTTLAIFLFLLLALIAWFPVPLSRNLLIYGMIYTAYFFVNNVIMMFLHFQGKDAAAMANYAKLSVGILCYSFWVFRLSRSGEERVTSLRLGRSLVEERRLLGQLENLNATLLRTARK